MGDYYLMHSGRSKRDGAKVGSGRYPLGSGERPFQNGGGPKERKRLFGRKKKEPVDTEPKSLSEEEKKRIIDSGDVTAAYKNRQFLTNADIDAVINRRNKETTLASMLPKKKKGMEYVTKATDVLDKSVKFVNAGINAWNVAVRINNAFNENKLKPIYAIGSPDKKKTN
jgi:hypothetical protein